MKLRFPWSNKKPKARPANPNHYIDENGNTVEVIAPGTVRITTPLFAQSTVPQVPGNETEQ